MDDGDGSSEDCPKDPACSDAVRMPQGGSLCLARPCRTDLEMCSEQKREPRNPRGGRGSLELEQTQDQVLDYVWAQSEPPRHLAMLQGATVQVDQLSFQK